MGVCARRVAAPGAPHGCGGAPTGDGVDVPMLLPPLAQDVMGVEMIVKPCFEADAGEVAQVDIILDTLLLLKGMRWIGLSCRQRRISRP